MFTDRTVVSWVLCLLSLVSLASCFGKAIKIKGSDAAVAGQQSDGRDASGEVGPGDGPGPVADSKIATDGLSSNGGAGVDRGTGGNSGTVDSSVAGSGGSSTGGSSVADSGVGGGGGGAGGVTASDASANGGSNAGGSSGAGSGGSTGGGIAGSSGTGPDAAPDVPPDVPVVDAPGTCSADKECPSETPLCLGNRCARCAGDSDCAGRAGPACAASGSCVACTSDKQCTGAAKTCDTTTNQCVGCVTRSDCAGACQTCTSGVCAAVKGQDDLGFCDGTCDSTGACKKKQGQACLKTADCAGGIPCVDGYCCKSTCTGSCQACDVANSLGSCTTLSNGTAPRAGHPPCDGSGMCMGTCNGLSASCTYPGAETTCVQASCIGQTATLATGCAGDGTCPHADTKPCNGYGCSTTQPVCLTSCPVSGQILCSGSCVDVQSSPSHCGATCIACGGATPKCVSGSCVQCATNADCGGATPKCVSGNCVQCSTNADCTSGVCTNNTCTCSAPDPCPGKCGSVADTCGIVHSCSCSATGQFCYSGTCSCRQSSAGNLLSNGGFETSLGIAGWEADSYGIYHFVTWDSEDSDGCVGSGSLRDFQPNSTTLYREPRRCVVVGPNQKVYYGARFKTDLGTASFCDAFEMYDTACAVDQGTPGYRIGGGTSPSWTNSSTSFTTNADTQALYIECTLQGKIDQVYMNLSVNNY